MKRLRILTVFACAALPLLIPACGRAPVDLPPLPAVSTDGVLPAVRAQMESAREAVEAMPENASKNGDYAMILHAYDRSEHASAMYERARLLAPKDPRWPFYQSAVLERLGNVEGSLQALDEALALAPGHVDVLAKRAETLFNLGRLDEAEDEIAKVIAINPSYPLAQFYRGRLHVERQEWQLAVDVYEDLLSRGLNVRDLHQNLGVAHRMLGHADEAASHLAIAERDQGLFIKSFDPVNMVIAKLNVGDQPHLLRARELYATGKLEQARSELLTAVGKNPDSLGAHLHLIRIYAEQGSLPDARRHYERVMEIEPTNAVAHASWGLALSQTKRFDDAVEAYGRASAADPGDPQYPVAAANVLGRLGRHDEARVQIDKALALDPENRNALYLRGNNLLATGDHAGALQVLQTLRLPEDRRTPVVLRGIAIAQDELGHRDMAIQQMEAALAMAKKHNNKALAASLEAELKNRFQSGQD